MDNVSLISAFVAGIASFISPCVLPPVPGYVSFISGISLEKLRSNSADSSRRNVIITSLIFIAGFSTVFVLLGGASATFAGKFLLKNKILFNRIGGALIIVLGLHVAGLFQIRFLNYEKRMNMNRKPMGALSAYFVGLAFAAGWTPCIRPILAAILIVASNQQTSGRGILLLASYSLGLAIPFFITAVALNSFFGFFSWMKKHYRTIEFASGGLLVLLGFMVMTNQFTRLAGYFNSYGW